MIKLFTLLIIVFTIQSCENTTQRTAKREASEEIENDIIHPSKYDDPADSLNNEQIPLGEDQEEINAYIKNIYERNGIVYVDLDFVVVKYENVDERVIVNRNPKIRTYIVDLDTYIMTKDCKKITSLEMLKHKSTLLKDTSTLVIGQSKDGKMLSLNFGCYG
ncbi:MAG: hypothetical protein LBF27_04415 [Sphingobacterium sp.]|jgi:hypothetical protein|nr:hypothetical protein [Sphingobacterium sp.]